MEHSSISGIRVVSSARLRVLFIKSLLMIRRPLLQISWGYLRRIGVGNSLPLFRSLTKAIQRLIKVSNLLTQLELDYTAPFKDMVKKFGLETNTVDFIGHAVALYTNDDFIENSALETVERIKLYMSSIGKYGDSPFIYPIYGLSGLAEGFSRLCALYGGTYMLNRDIDEILYDENGKFVGIKSQGEVIINLTV
jgi:RAB protein geranylgeranyltransferase component A